MIKELELKKKSKSTKLTSTEKRILEAMSKTQTCMSQFFTAKKKKKSLAVTTAATIVVRASVVIDFELSATHVAVRTRNKDSNVSDTTSKMRIITCKRIFSDYNKPDMQPVLSTYVLHASINVNSSYKAAFIGQRKLV